MDIYEKIELNLEEEEHLENEAEKLVKLLAEKEMSLSMAESCTGGLISAAITDVSGASGVLSRSFVTYANSAKEELLGVKKETLEKHGAVSPETAFEMAKGVRKAAEADLGISATGIAGPTGGTPKKPVGLVYVGLSAKEETRVLELRLKGSRRQVREATVRLAIEKAINLIEK